MSWLGLDGKTVIVTGGAAGIGKAVCEGLAEVRANVVIGDMNEAAGTALAADLTKRFDTRAIFCTLDVTQKTSVEQTIEATRAEFGSVDVLVNNAGINIPRLLVDPAGKQELTEDVWDKVVAVNQKGMYLCAQAAARVMMQQDSGGVILNMASESGMEGSEGQSVYASTKAAAYNLTRSWAKELGRHGIRVAGIAPGILEKTEMRSEVYEESLAYSRSISVEQLRAGYEKVSIPLGRSGTLEEVANTVCFLASSRAGYIHGSVVNVSGGKTWA